MPELTGIPMRTPGMKLFVAPGTTVLVAFANMSPTRPYVLSYDPTGITLLDIPGYLHMHPTGVGPSGTPIPVVMPP